MLKNQVSKRIVPEGVNLGEGTDVEGNIDMGLQYKLVNLIPGTDPTDSVSKVQMDTAITDAFFSYNSNFSIGTNKIFGNGNLDIKDSSNAASYQMKNIKDPTSNQDAATKYYVDNHAVTPKTS